MERNTEITIVILILVGAIAIIVALALANQAQQQFERQYALSNFFKVIGINLANGQSSDTIMIKGVLREGGSIFKDLYLQNASILFGSSSSICPSHNCDGGFEDTTFDESGQDRVLSGTVKIENKSNSDANFKTFDYYKLSGSFHLANSKQNLKTGEETLLFEGDLGVDKDDAIFSPAFQFKSKAQLSADNFQLNGTIIK